MFENKTAEGIHYSRFIASWIRSGGDGRYMGHFGSKFDRWLRTLVINGRYLTEDEMRDIRNLAGNGKLELETSAERFIKNCK